MYCMLIADVENLRDIIKVLCKASIDVYIPLTRSGGIY